jgi:hypothetical protein
MQSTAGIPQRILFMVKSPGKQQKGSKPADFGQDQGDVFQKLSNFWQPEHYRRAFHKKIRTIANVLPG